MGKRQIPQPICGFNEDKRLKEYLCENFYDFLYTEQEDIYDNFDSAIDDFFIDMYGKYNYSLLYRNTDIIVMLGLRYFFKNGITAKSQCCSQHIIIAALKEIKEKQYFMSELKQIYKSYNSEIAENNS